jgi:hypothetical protein
MDDPDISSGHYGELPLNQSQLKTQRKYSNVKDLNKMVKDTLVWVQGRLHTCSGKGKQCFILIHQQAY